MYGDIPCLDITLPFMPRCLPKLMDDLRPMIRQTEAPEWEDAPPANIPTPPPPEAVDAPPGPTREQMIALYHTAFQMLSEQITACLNGPLTLQMAAQISQAWPLGDDPC
jgi:hypothetical protein